MSIGIVSARAFSSQRPALKGSTGKPFYWSKLQRQFPCFCQTWNGKRAAEECSDPMAGQEKKGKGKWWLRRGLDSKLGGQ